MARPRKPTNLKLVEGNRGKRSLSNQEPDPEYLDDLTAPEYLDARAKAVWNEIAPALRRTRLLTGIDSQMLALGCIAVAQCRHATEKLKDNFVRNEIEIKGKPGEVTHGESLNPWLIVQSMSFKQAMAVFREFGMSPAARTRIAIQPQGDLFGKGKDPKAAGYFGD